MHTLVDDEFDRFGFQVCPVEPVSRLLLLLLLLLILLLLLLVKVEPLFEPLGHK